MSGSRSELGKLDCSTDVTTGAGFGCQIAQGIVYWLLIMFKLVLFGSGSVMLCSMGHNVNQTTKAIVFGSLLSMGFIALFTIVPAFEDGKLLPDEDCDEQDFLYDDQLIACYNKSVVNTSKEGFGPDKKFLVYIMVAFGALLLLLAMQNILDRLLPASYVDNSYILKRGLTSGTVKMERNMKQAASFKINQMIRNSLAIHSAAEFEHGSTAEKESSYGRALLTFVKKADDLEEVGGMCWAWKRLWNRKLFTEDGIW